MILQTCGVVLALNKCNLYVLSWVLNVIIVNVKNDCAYTVE